MSKTEGTNILVELADQIDNMGIFGQELEHMCESLHDNLQDQELKLTKRFYNEINPLRAQIT